MSEKTPSKFAEAWGHYAPDILTGVIVLVLVSTFTSGVGAHYQAGGALALILVVLVTWFQMRRHDRRPCARCLSKMPLNPADVARSQRRRFAVVHRAESRSLVFLYLVALVGSNLLITLPLGLPLALDVVLLAFWVGMQASMVYALRAYVTHHRLQPWCPWCSGGEGRDEVLDTPTPTPTVAA